MRFTAQFIEHLTGAHTGAPLQGLKYILFGKTTSGCRGRHPLQPNGIYATNPVGAGSRLPTRSNRKTIATGNLRPRPPEHTNKHRKFREITAMKKSF